MIAEFGLRNAESDLVTPHSAIRNPHFLPLYSPKILPAAGVYQYNGVACQGFFREPVGFAAPTAPPGGACRDVCCSDRALPFSPFGRTTVKMPTLSKITAGLRGSFVGAAVITASLVTALPGCAQSSGEMKQVAVVGLTDYDSLLADINFVGGLVGNPQMAQVAKQMGDGFTQGMDHSRPLGVIVQTDGANFNGAICAPIADIEAFTSNLAGLGVEATLEGDTWKITANGQELYARQAGEWALLSVAPPFLDGLPDDPAAVIAEITDVYDLGVKINVENIPDYLKQMAVAQIQQGIEFSLQPLPGESDEQFQVRKETAHMQMQQLEEMINGLAEVTIGLAIESENNRALLDFVSTAVEGSKLADQIVANADIRTNYAGFLQPDAAMMMHFASKMTEADIAQVNQMFGAMRNQVRTAIEEEADLPNDEAREAVIAAMDSFLDAFKATIEAGSMDGGAVLDLSPTSMTMVAGGFVADPTKVEDGLKKLSDIAKEDPEFPGIQWDAESHADVSFHTLSVPVPGPEPQKVFGETLEVAIGIGKQSVYFTLGRDCMEAVKKVIDDSAAAPDAEAKPMEMSVSLIPILELASTMADQDDAQTLEMIASVLKTEAEGRDHLRITSVIEDGASRARIELEDGVLRAIGIAVMQAQAQP